MSEIIGLVAMSHSPFATLLPPGDGEPGARFLADTRRVAAEVDFDVEPADKPASLLDPDAIAESYWHVMQQHRSAWSWEVELRPWVEKF